MARLLLIAALAVSGCKKKAPEVATDPGLVQSVDDPMQLVLVTPSAVPADTPTQVQIVGTGFERGAEVQIGEHWVSQVGFDNANQLSLTTPALADGRYDVVVQNPDGAHATLWAGLVAGSGQAGVVATEPCKTLTVYFTLDSAGLDDAATAAISAESACYAAWPGRVQIDGHADERGTTDYNLALGQRRAQSVLGHLVRQGLQSSQLLTTSFGEERPLERASTEQAWSRNRRVEVRPIR